MTGSKAMEEGECCQEPRTQLSAGFYPGSCKCLSEDQLSFPGTLVSRISKLIPMIMKYDKKWR